MAEVTFRFSNTEIALTATGNNVYANGLIRVVNFDPAAKYLCTLQYANATAYATFTIRNGETMFVQKAYTDLILVTGTVANVVVTPVKRGSI